MKTKLVWIALAGFLASLFMGGCQGCGSPIPDTPDGTVKVVAAEIEKGNTLIVWQALPLAYQSDVNRLVSQAATKMDVEIWEKGVSVLKKVTVVAREKKSFILSSQWLAEAKVDKAELEKGWDQVVSLLQIVAESELARPADLQRFDGGAFLGGTGRELWQKMKEISTLLPGHAPKSFADLKVEQVSSTDQEAVLKVTLDGQSELVTMKKSGERWIPKQLADEWSEGVKQLQSRIDAMTGNEMAAQKPQILAMMGAMEAGLDQLNAATSQEEFDAMLQGLLMGIWVQ